MDSWKDGNLEDGKDGKVESLKLEKWKGDEADRWKVGKVWQVGRSPLCDLRPYCVASGKG